MYAPFPYVFSDDYAKKQNTNMIFVCKTTYLEG